MMEFTLSKKNTTKLDSNNRTPKGHSEEPCSHFKGHFGVGTMCHCTASERHTWGEMVQVVGRVRNSAMAKVQRAEINVEFLRSWDWTGRELTCVGRLMQMLLFHPNEPLKVVATKLTTTFVWPQWITLDTNGRWALNNLNLTSVPQLVLYEFFFTAGERLPWQCTTEWGRKCRVTGRHDSRFGKPFFPRALQELCSIMFGIVLPSNHQNQELRPVFCNVAFFAVSLCCSQLRTTGWNSDRWVSRRKVCSLKWSERSSASLFF